MALKKFFAATTMLATVLSVSMVSAPKAQAASAGDLIKMNGLSSVYYLGGDGKRYVFPNETTYFSWYNDFSSVVTISQAELEALPLGANVTVRPGTRLVKITTNPKVYAVEAGGNLVAISDEATAKTLYGDNWAKRVSDIADAFFTNYKISSKTVSATAYPQGSLVKFGTGADVYMIDADGKARKIANEAAFNANRFSWNNIITASIAMPATGADITGAETALTDVSSGAGGVAGAGTGLTVALSADTLASTNVPSYATLIPFTTVNLTASNDGAVTVNDVTFTRFGTGLTSDFSGGYLFSGDTRLTNIRSVNSSDNKITFTNVGLTIPAGTTKSLTLKMNARTDATVSGSHSFRIASASDIATNGASISGSFPVAGNMMSFSSSASAATVTLAASTNLYNKKVGETNTVIGEFTVNNTNMEDVTVSRIRLKQDGDAANNAVSNFSLELDGTIVATGVSMVDKYVDFKLATPFVLKKSKQINATVRGDIVTDIGKTVELFVNNIADVEAKGSAYGNFYSAKIDATGFTSTDGDIVTIKGSEVNISFDGPNATEVKDNSTNVVLANMVIKAENEDINVETLKVVLDNTKPTAEVYTATNSLQNLELVDTANNSSYGATADPAAGASATVTFENVYLKKGVSYKFAIRGDVQDNVAAGFAYKASIDNTTWTARYVASDKALVSTDYSSNVIAGKVMTVAAPAATFSTVATANSSIVKGSAGVLLYEGKVAANNVDNLTVTRVKMAAASGDVTAYSSVFGRAYMYKVNADGTETKLTDTTDLAGNAFTFSGFTLNVPKGTTNAVVYRVRADVKTNPTASSSALKVSALASDHIVRDADGNSVTPSVSGATAGGTFTVATSGSYALTVDTSETGTNVDKNVLAGTNVLVGRLKVTASKEKAKIEKLALAAAGDATNSDVREVSLYKESTMTTKLGAATIENGFVYFEDLNIEVPTTGATYLYVGAALKGIDYSDSPASDATAAAGKTIAFAATSTATYNTKVVGVSTGEELADATYTAADVTKTATVYGAVMTGLTTSFANGTLSEGVKDVFSFKVTAPASTNVAVDGTELAVKMATTSFTVASSTGITLSGLKISRVGGAGEVSAVNSTISGNTITVDFLASYLAANKANDLLVKPGQTVEFVLTATVAGISGTGKSLQVTMEGVDTTVGYVHGTTANTNTGIIRPLISGVTAVRGGSLTN